MSLQVYTNSLRFLTYGNGALMRRKGIPLFFLTIKLSSYLVNWKSVEATLKIVAATTQQQQHGHAWTISHRFLSVLPFKYHNNIITPVVKAIRRNLQ